MKIHINKKLILLFNDLFVFGLAILTSVMVSRIFGLEYLGLSVYFFVFIGPLISILRFSIDKKILALRDLWHVTSLHTVAYGSSMIIFSSGLLLAYVIGENYSERLFLVMVLLLRLAQVNLKYLVNFKIRTARYIYILKLLLLVYALPVLVILTLYLSGFDAKRTFYIYILYLSCCVSWMFVRNFGILLRGFIINFKEHVSLTTADFLVTLKTAVPRYFMDLLLGREMLGIVAICQQLAQLSDILPGVLIKLRSGRMVSLVNQSEFGKMKQLRNGLTLHITFLLIVINLVLLSAHIPIFTLIYGISDYPSLLLLLSFMIVRVLANIINVDKFVLNVMNSSVFTIVPLLKILIFLVLSYLIMTMAKLENEIIIVIPLILSEILLLIQYQKRIKLALI